MNLVEKAIVSVFPSVETAKLSPETKLGALPGWDSMNSINLQIEIESATGRSNLGLVLTDRLTVQEVVCELNKLGVSV